MRILLFAAALATGQPLSAAPEVVTDIPPVASLVAAVMDGAGTPAMIGAGASDPHGGSLRPSDASAIERADVIFWVGHDLEPWLEEPLAQLAGSARIVALGEVESVIQRPFREGAVFAELGHDTHAEHADNTHDDHADDTDAHADDDHDHAHGAHDPHHWLDPLNASIWVGVIADVLSQADPENAALYASNAQKVRAHLDALTREIAVRLDGIDPAFVVAHDALGHFEARFGLGAIAAVSDGDAARPGPRRVDAVRRAAREAGAVCLLVEPGQGGRVPVEGLRTEVIDPLGQRLDPGPALYARMMRDLADTIAGCVPDAAQ